MILGTFPKATSKGFFFPSINLPNMQLPKSVLVAALGPLAFSSRSARLCRFDSPNSGILNYLTIPWEN